MLFRFLDGVFEARIVTSEENKRLKAENADLRNDNAALHKQVEALTADKERLEAFVKNNWSIDCRWWSDEEKFRIWNTNGQLEGSGNDFREAIDEAMGAREGGEGK